jgi:hypothetical protein
MKPITSQQAELTVRYLELWAKLTKDDFLKQYPSTGLDTLAEIGLLCDYVRQQTKPTVPFMGDAT